MTRIDQFESLFTAAAKTPYVHGEVEIGSVLVVTDLAAYEARLFGDRVRSFLRVLGSGDGGDGGGPAWRDATGEECRTLGALLDLVEAQRPDLVCTYRNLHTDAWKWPFSLGDHLEVLTQATTTPVLVMPRPDDEEAWAGVAEDTGTVMAITDHLTGDHRLVDAAARFTEPGGTLLLAHVEDRRVFERYLETISKIPDLDTETAQREILKQLEKEPRDYIASCRAVLEALDPPVKVQEVVALGHRVSEYRRLIGEHGVDLLVFHAKDEDQLAMHGVAYPLAVELRALPLLML